MRKLLFLFIIQLLSLHLLATDFTVTSNADTGPGTLRQALLDAAANGTAETDYIYFNITDNSLAGRTITLVTKLPNVSSNLVIDGTTQPGTAFGVSGAKIILQPQLPDNTFDAFTLSNIDNFALYGLYIRDFTGYVPGVSRTTVVFYTNASSNLQIGAPGKGNVFANNGMVIGNGWVGNGVSGLKFYSNFCGFEPDGKTMRPLKFQGAQFIDLTSCSGNIEIGGDDPATRNYFGFATYYIAQHSFDPRTSNPSIINIKNNYFDFDIDGKPVVNPFTTTTETYFLLFVDASSYYDYHYPFTYNIINNKIQNPLSMWTNKTVTGNVTIQGNQILQGVNKNRGEVRNIINTDGTMLIGGDEPGQANTIYNEQLLIAGLKSTLVLHNSIYCAPTLNWLDGPDVYSPGNNIKSKLPLINITKITTTSVSGTASPLSEIQLFLDDDCIQCEPQTYITTLYADQHGDWSYSGEISKGIIASATLNGFTSPFTIEAQQDNSPLTQRIHYSCDSKGYITGLKFKNAGGYEWSNAAGDIIGNQPDIKDLTPGKYSLKLLNNSCSKSYIFNIYDATPKISDVNKHIIQPSCNSKGSIDGLYLNNADVYNEAMNNGIYNIYTYKWLDANGNIKSTTLNLNNVDAGTYKLEVTYNNTCTTTYGPVTLINTTGPNINQSTAVITPTNCGQSTGSITGITATGTGTLKYSWKNTQNIQVATTQDLTNQPGGKYTLQVTDDTNCGPVYTSTIEIPELNSITIDASQAITAPAACDANGGGSVKGIKVTGAMQYQWLNDVNAIVGTNVDLDNAPPGNYHLVASNSTCSKQSVTYPIIKHVNNKTYRITSSQTTYATCNIDNGHIEIVMNATYDIPATYRWVNTQGITVGATLTLTNLPVNTYTLYGADDFGCEKLILTTNLIRVPVLNFNQNQMIITPDQCGLGKGSIHGLRISGGHPTYTLSWKNSSGTVMGNTADIDNLLADTYILTVTDLSDCGLLVGRYTIGDNQAALQPPVVSDLQLCSSGDALLSVNNSVTGFGYRLYDNANSSTPIGDEKSGKFKVNVKTATSYYVSQYTGNCESSRAEVKVILGGLSDINLPNAFSPNGDGINDTWKIPGVENYPNASVQIFTRAGQKIYESIGYTSPFDGVYQGKPLPIGSYYYIINLNSGCGLLSGSVTIIR